MLVLQETVWWGFFAMFDTGLHVPWFEYLDLLWNIPEFVTEDSLNSVQLCICVA